ncbi:MAG: PQQ-dependent sugar dehydrogenase [Pirellulaceae bacterium]
MFRTLYWQRCLAAGLVLTVAATLQSDTRANEPAPAANVGVQRVLDHLEIGRPIVLTHAGDGSGRFFIASQYGEIYVLDSAQSTDEPRLFLDLTDRVRYSDRENEEGFLGLAFHPDFKENGKFLVYYTTNKEPHVSVVSMFSVSADDPQVADPASEVEVMRIPQPFWNHNGGTIVFGPDGCLYVALGDGGAGRDPMGNGQNLGTWLGSILRVEVNLDANSPHRYLIPDDNPFVGKEGAKPEIWAYGLRNVWRMSFDRETGQLWAADVGQDVWEEIDLIVRGGNYGWNVREGKHQFDETDRRVDGVTYIDPIFEYDHTVGKSITGGNVYRGTRIEALSGRYVYGDYVSGKLWSLAYDAETKEVDVQDIDCDESIAVITFGEDEAGEIYFSDAGGRIFSFK